MNAITHRLWRALTGKLKHTFIKTKNWLGIFEVQENATYLQPNYLDSINISVDLSEDEIKDYFRNGQH